MARQASSSMGGIVGVVVGAAVIGALIATPFYISSLSTDGARLGSETGAAVETVRRAIVNLDEHLVRISHLSVDGEDSDATTGPVEIPEDQQKTLRQMSQNLQQLERKDDERGTGIESKRVATGPANARQLKAVIAEHNKLMTEAKQALSEIDAATVGESRGGNSLAGARVKALYKYASARIELNHVAFLHWRADQSLNQASRLISQIAELRRVSREMASLSPGELTHSIESRIATIEDEARQKSGQLAELDGTIADYKARVESLDATSRQNRLQMADMQMRSEPIYGQTSRYAQLSTGARQAESEADALRYGTLQGATPVLRDLDDLVGLEYEGGTPIVGLFALERIAGNLREQLASLTATREALIAQSKYYETAANGIDATVNQAVTDAEQIASQVDSLVAEAQSLEGEINKSANAATNELKQAISAAQNAATAASQWKQDLTSSDAAPDSPAGELSAMVNSDGHMEGSMYFLKAECAYQVAAVNAEQIRILKEIHDTKVKGATATDSEIPTLSTERIEASRVIALEQLAVAEKEYEKAKNLFRASKAQLGSRAIQGKDTEWQAMAGKAAVHLLRSTLQEDRTARIAEKDAAYELLKTVAEGREQSELMSPAVDLILELQSNPS